MLPHHAVGDAGQKVFRLRVMRTCRNRFIGTRCYDVISEPDIHFGLDCIDWGGSLYRIGRFAMAFWAGAGRENRVELMPCRVIDCAA